jgi:hypothetical protein
VNHPATSRSRGCLICSWIAFATFLAAAYYGFSAADHAGQEELNLHATRYVIRLVNHFVQQKGRWPDSWAELEAMPFGFETPQTGASGTNIVRVGGAMDFDWPGQSSELQKRVTIDFAASEADVIAEEVIEFKPIRPNGPGFAYWKYGDVEELQESLRKAIDGEEAGATAL